MFRIKKYKKGYVVEVQKQKWYGKKYWIHYISVSGISSEPWFFKSYDLALNDLLQKIKFNLIQGGV